ncbi:hypothetical protein MMC17_001910 [Xylographa soralifera]|nr:hypothetical protein [Xylographa soralifera]
MLLTLSRELRDLIYTAVLQAEIAPPSSESGPRYNARLSYNLPPALVNSNVLLLINHQIHEETKEAIHNLTKSGQLRYKLDCILVNGRHIYPTWLSIPALSATVSRVEVDFRPTLEGHQLISGRVPDVGFSISWDMFTLLDQFLEKSPDFESGLGEGGIMRIDELILTVVTPSPITPRRVLRSTIMRNRDETAQYCLLHSEAVCETLTSSMDSVFRDLRARHMDNPCWHGAVTKVRFIKIFLDGELKQIWNVTEMLTRDASQEAVVHLL